MRQIEFKALAESDTTPGQYQWYYYGIGGRPQLLGWHYIEGAGDLQFTGQFDKQGAKIYDSDIVTWKSGAGPWITATVHYSDEWAQWFKGSQSLSSYKKTTKLIGNQHQKPEVTQ